MNKIIIHTIIIIVQSIIVIKIYITIPFFVHYILIIFGHLYDSLFKMYKNNDFQSMIQIHHIIKVIKIVDKQISNKLYKEV